MQLRNGRYYIQGVELSALAADFGTPLYIYDAEKIANQVSVLKEAFSSVDLHIKYAVKALTNVSILSFIRQQGVGADVVSVNEARLALLAGYRPENIVFTPNGVLFEEVEEAVELGLNINLDNLPTIEKFARKFGSKKSISLRLNPGILAGGNYKISTGHSQSKFGIPVTQLDEVKKMVKEYGLTVSGLHIHTGSEISDIGVFLQVADVLFNEALDFPSLTFLDFGGGFKVAYKPEDNVTDIGELGRALSERFNAFCAQHHRKLQLWIEPGKFLVSEAGILLVETTVVKHNPELTFIHVNSGLNHLVRPMMYDAHHEVINVSNPQGPRKPYTVVGTICETDTLAANRLLPEAREGDLLAILNAGAYGYSMASNYNARLRPAEVLIHNSTAHVIRTRETFDDLLRGQHPMHFATR
jgi:diaminopimelate decarboxylase